MPTLINQLSAIQLLPVIVINHAPDVLPLGRALGEGGLAAMEITFRTPAAAEAIRLLRTEQPDMLIGAGTVLTPEQAQAAQKAGASFIISPGFNERTARVCADLGLDYIPGVNNPSAIEAALNHNLTLLKFFPAQASGGISMLKALLAPYQEIQIMPTGGIHLENIRDYLALDRVPACGGSWIADAARIKAHDWSYITERTREAVQHMNNSK